MIPLLHRAVTAQAERRPDAIALVMGAEIISYQALETTSNQLAHLLREAGCAKGDRICLLMPKSPQAIACMLGILKADCLYVPLDPASPAPRLGKILASCEASLILGAGNVLPVLSEVVGQSDAATKPRIGWMSQQEPSDPTVRPFFHLKDLSRYPGSQPDSSAEPGDPAHILFTSGSTGAPKGVVITHANVVSFLEWAHHYFGTAPEDRVSGHPPLHFDLSTFDIFGTLSAGATLYLVPGELTLFPQKVTEFIRHNELTQWFSVPSALVYMARFDAIRQNDFPTLKRLLWCGEVFPTPSLIYWMQRLPHVQFTNLYGPTEATVASSYYTVPECPADPKQAVPIGTPCSGEQLLVLDEHLSPAPPGQPGDLYIAGTGLSPGYWQDQDKTSSAFLFRQGADGATSRVYRTGDLARQDADGLFYYLGRSDSQIKSRGYRIELGEVETAVHSVIGIRECAVVAIPSTDFEGHTICCAYVCDPDRSLSPADLRREVSALLPQYMLPSRWLTIERFPKNANGKIDRPALREQFQAAHALENHAQ